MVNDQAIDVLRADSTLFRRSEQLVTVRWDDRENKLIKRPEEAPWISALPESSIRERLTEFVRWGRKSKSKEGEKVTSDHPPGWRVSGVAERGEYPTIRHLEAIIEAPAMLGVCRS